ncbi:DNA-binding transcriptional regulator, AcrR family [Brevibacterium sandarakinum]|uniref:DNA-binding transcriptional regulator, AcrR family n=1 Tax=Brevibacterium sandarakinum TaxID=629680 RepID=A0A1H1XCI1_BRESA|nr:DNA-binding transcriptional regulator, AcrR family [Brevibacterium sandarakinum]
MFQTSAASYADPLAALDRARDWEASPTRRSPYHRGMSTQKKSAITEATSALSARRRLLDAAHRLFYSHGIHAIGIDSVIADAGVAKMTLYRHFGSKDELVAAYLGERDEYWRARWLNCSASGDRVTRVTEFFDVIAEWVTEKGFRGCAFINAHGEHEQGPATTAAIERHKHWIRCYLIEMAGDAELGEQLFILAEGATVAATMAGSSMPPLRARSAALALVAQQGQSEEQAADHKDAK